MQEIMELNRAKADPSTPIPYRLSIAPMMDYTDRYYRMLMRFITSRTWLYTEMISSGAILHGNEEQHLLFDPNEKPLIAQLGGSVPEEMAEAARIAADYGYDEINVNAGCPSPRVSGGGFGVCLMDDCKHSAEIVHRMQSRLSIPVSVKCRIGFDGTACGMGVRTSFEHLCEFVAAMRAAGAVRVTIHARIAILERYNPKENREIPPLRYEDVYRIAQSMPDYPIELNGGVHSFQEAEQHLQHVHAVMMGRAAIQHPLLFCAADSVFHANAPLRWNAAERQDQFQYGCEIARQYADYLQRCISHAPSPQQQRHIRHALRHLIPFFAGEKGSRKWRQSLTHSLVSGEDPLKAVEKSIASIAVFR